MVLRNLPETEKLLAERNLSSFGTGTIGLKKSPQNSSFRVTSTERTEGGLAVLSIALSDSEVVLQHWVMES